MSPYLQRRPTKLTVDFSHETMGKKALGWNIQNTERKTLSQESGIRQNCLSELKVKYMHPEINKSQGMCCWHMHLTRK